MERGRPVIIAGNWKMHKSIEEAVESIKRVIPLASPHLNDDLRALLAVPFTALSEAALAAEGSRLEIGAQNMCDASEGAFTGEIAGRMIRSAGGTFVLLGHSERRHHFNESSEFIHRKVRRALKEGLTPLLCIGETLEQREAGEMDEVLKQQIEDSLSSITAEELSSLIVAYEPVWAIGTGVTATPLQAEEAHRFCRETIAARWGRESASRLPLLYGGSVKADNCRELLAEANIDGLLIGGASLDPQTFATIIARAAKEGAETKHAEN